MIAEMTIHLSDQWINNFEWFTLGLSYGLLTWLIRSLYVAKKKRR